MASLDYGSGGVDGFADYEWSGQHRFTIDSDVLIEFNVDVTDPNQALRAVNAGTVVSYVDNTFAQLLAEGNTTDFNSSVGFMGNERTYFAINPFLGEAISLWDIDDLASWPDQIQLQSAVTIGNVKDYVDQNLSFAVDYVLNTAQETVVNEITIQLPQALPAALASAVPPMLDDYAVNAIFPEVDRRIAAASGGSGGSLGLSEEDVNGIIDTRLPIAIEGYMDSNVYPFIDQRTIDVMTPVLEGVKVELRSELTTIINDSIAENAGLTEAEVVSLIDARLPNFINTALDARLPDAIRFHAAPIVQEALASQLPDAITEGITNNSDVILGSLDGEISQAVDDKLTTDLPIIVRNEVNNQLPSSVAQHLDLTLGDVVGSYVTAIVPREVTNELTSRLTTETLWPIVQDPAGEQARLIAESYLNSETLWPIVQDLSGIQSFAIASSLVTEQFTQANVWNLVEGLSATQATGLINAALVEFENDFGGLSAEAIWSLINGQLQTTIDNTITEAFPSLAEGVITENLTAAVAAELQQQLPAVMPDQVGQILNSVLPEEVQQQVFTNLQIALAEGGLITTAIETRVDTRADERINDALENAILPRIASEVTGAAETIVPPIVQDQVASQLDNVLPSLVEATVQEALQPELDTLVNTTIPNVVNLQMSSSLPSMVDTQLTARYGQGKPSVHIRYKFDIPQQFWVIEHEFIGAPFTERLYNSSGRPMYASIEVVNETSFVVTLTEAMTGWVDVEFYI